MRISVLYNPSLSRAPENEHIVWLKECLRIKDWKINNVIKLFFLNLSNNNGKLS